MTDPITTTSTSTVGAANFDNMDIESMFMSLVSERANVLDSAITERAKAMQDRNAQISAINDDVVKIRTEMQGMDKDSKEYKNKELDLQNKQTQIDSLSSNSQLDMIQLQGLINKRNQSVDMLTNLVEKFSKTMDGIVSNMR
jgi:predicted  nucleic acid-binding Zn-ribbon protein